MPNRDAIIVQLRNPVGKGDPLPVLRVFDDSRMLRLKRAFFEDTVRQVAEIPDVDIKLSVAPPERAGWANDAIANLSRRYATRPDYVPMEDRTEVFVQEVAPLEERTADSLRRGLDAGYRRLVLVGGYIPTLDTQRVTDALHHLQTHPLILGPTIEGGCYLIGLRSDCRQAVGLVTVGSDVAYKKSISELNDAGLNWQEVDLSYDVGHQEDLEFIVNEINHRRYTGDEETARCTEEILAQFMKEAAKGDN